MRWSSGWWTTAEQASSLAKSTKSTEATRQHRRTRAAPEVSRSQASWRAALRRTGRDSEAGTPRLETALGRGQVQRTRDSCPLCPARTLDRRLPRPCRTEKRRDSWARLSTSSSPWLGWRWRLNQRQSDCGRPSFNGHLLRRQNVDDDARKIRSVLIRISLDVGYGSMPPTNSSSYV